MASKSDNGTGIMKAVDSEPDLSHMKDAVELRHGVYLMLCTILFFQFVNWIIRSQGPPKTLRDDEWKWRNLYVSWIHALICSIWTILSAILYPELFSNLLQHINYFTYFNVCFTVGYFFYDFLDLLLNNKVFEMWEVTLHHIAVNGMFYYNVHIKENIAFNIVALFVEVHTFCLHWRKLLQMVGTPYNCRKYIIVKYLNLCAFALFRFGATFTVTWGIFAYHNRVTWTYYICITLSMLFMNILNFVLFWRLLRSDILRKRSGVNGSACRNIQKDCQALSGYELLSTEDTMGHEAACKKSD